MGLGKSVTNYPNGFFDHQNHYHYPILNAPQYPLNIPLNNSQQNAPKMFTRQYQAARPIVAQNPVYEFQTPLLQARIPPNGPFRSSNFDLLNFPPPMPLHMPIPVPPPIYIPTTPPFRSSSFDLLNAPIHHPPFKSASFDLLNEPFMPFAPPVYQFGPPPPTTARMHQPSYHVTEEELSSSSLQFNSGGSWKSSSYDGILNDPAYFVQEEFIPYNSNILSKPPSIDVLNSPYHRRHVQPEIEHIREFLPPVVVFQ